MTEFNVGSIVRPVWDETARGKVVEIKDGIRIVEWFQGDLDLLSRAWHVNNLKFVTPVEKNVNTTTKWRCKPIENMFEVFKGGFTHVVIQDGVIVAAFTSFEDAETYKENLYDDAASIRELES